MEGGSIAWINLSKGYGMILHDDGREILFHTSSLRFMADQLRQGDRVSFDVFATRLGWEASNIRII